jgi:putative transposase
MASVPALTEITVSQLWQEVNTEETLWGDVSRHTLDTVKRLLEDRMDAELRTYLKAGRYARTRSRRDFRNGSYVRRLTTTWGTLPLDVPRARCHGFTPSVLPRYQRRAEDVNTLVRGAFLGGVSTRQVGPLLATLLDDQLSATTVSAITQTLDHAVAAFHRRPLTDDWVYLFLDAVSLRTKTPDGSRRRVALVAYAIAPDGRRELLDFRLVRHEGHGTWEAFLITLAARGLTGSHLRLITTDGHRGLHLALEYAYPHVPRQACWVHVLRNVSNRLRVRDREACLRLARRIYLARSRPAAERALQLWRQAWGTTAPAAVATLLREWDSLLIFFDVPEADWRKVRTTNAIERIFREIRRRTRPMTCFTNTPSCERIMYAIIHAINRRYATRKRTGQCTQNS